MKYLPISPSLLFALLPFMIQACGESSTQTLKEAWNSANNPSILDMKNQAYAARYVYDWKRLPLNGQLTTRPWSDDYWPNYKGGISYRWNDKADSVEARYAYDLKPADNLSITDMFALSPAEKLDLFLSESDYPNTMFERARTQVLKTVRGNSDFEEGYSIETWEGLCHAWAPASLLFKEPRSVTLTNDQGRQIPFGASDVKALLTYTIHKNGGLGALLGQRCNVKFSEYLAKFNEGSITEEEYKSFKESAECRDTNAGAFHLVLANQIGKLDEGFIADITRDYEVWNQPVHRYTSEIVQDKLQASPGAAPGTVREISLETTMYYVSETIPHWDVEVFTFQEATRLYRYRIELDAKDQIIGGEWLNDQRPDFLWKPFQRKGRFPEDLAIKKIYEASISGSP